VKRGPNVVADKLPVPTDGQIHVARDRAEDRHRLLEFGQRNIISAGHGVMLLVEDDRAGMAMASASSPPRKSAAKADLAVEDQAASLATTCMSLPCLISVLAKIVPHALASGAFVGSGHSRVLGQNTLHGPLSKKGAGGDAHRVAATGRLLVLAFHDLVEHPADICRQPKAHVY
jgi:hypothetical protein